MEAPNPTPEQQFQFRFDLPSVSLSGATPEDNKENHAIPDCCKQSGPKFVFDLPNPRQNNPTLNSTSITSHSVQCCEVPCSISESHDSEEDPHNACSLDSDDELSEGTEDEDDAIARMTAAIAKLRADGDLEGNDDDDDEDGEEQEETEEDEEAADQDWEGEDPEPDLFRAEVEKTFHLLAGRGIRVVEPGLLEFDKSDKLGTGGNATVCAGSMDLKEVAIKTVSIGGRLSNFQSELLEFRNEVLVGHAASRTEKDVRSRVCTPLAAAFEMTKRRRTKVRLYLVMERINAAGDLHDAVIQAPSSWQCVRDDGRDTGARLNGYLSVEDDPQADVFGYVLPVHRKLQLAQEVARCLLQLKARGVVHLDIKPPNLLVCEDGSLKLIDFGEAVMHSPDGTLQFTAGTPGYMAPEVVYGEGSYSADMFSAGVSLLELWVGSLWGHSKGGTSEQEIMQQERADALDKLHRLEPKVAQLLRSCLHTDPNRRIGPKNLAKSLKSLVEASRSNKPNSKVTKSKGHKKGHRR